MTEEIRELGKYIVANPGVYHGVPTFRGTRIPVSDVLYYVGKGKSWDWIVWNYDESFPVEAIAEAVALAAKAFEEQQEVVRAGA